MRACVCVLHVYVTAIERRVMFEVSTLAAALSLCCEKKVVDGSIFLGLCVCVCGSCVSISGGIALVLPESRIFCLLRG